jgi:hypothetical protein
MTLLLRTLTLKSKLGFGYSEIKNLTIQELLIMNKQAYLISCYYNLSMINFSTEVLNKLSINGDLIIEKPGKNPELHKTAVNNYYNNKTEKEATILRNNAVLTKKHNYKRQQVKDNLRYSKSMLKGKNEKS